MAYQSQKLQLSKSVSSTLDVELEFCKWLYGYENRSDSRSVIRHAKQQDIITAPDAPCNGPGA